MQSPSLEEINEIRKTGFRPQVVACFLNNKRILFLFNEEYDLWQFPQGGIDNNETVETAIAREMKEELGSDFVENIEIGAVIKRDLIEFPRNNWDSRILKTDEGMEILMKGKEYFFVVIDTKNEELDIKQTEFNDYKWASYEEALEITEKIYQKGKKRITKDVLRKLREMERL